MDSEPAALDGTPYRFVRPLGQGGMSTVVEAEHIGLAQRVVVKLLRPELNTRADLIERLRLEAQSLARLAHPNLVRVTDFGRSPSGRAFLVMEYLAGKTVAQEIRERGAIPAAEAIDWMRQTLAGLAAAHSVGLVHRDVKPENLFVCDGCPRTIKVLDFGIAKLSADAALSGVEPAAPLTREGVALGTPHFTAPEQIQGGIVTPATDVYSAGLVLYELVTGKHPFAGRTTTDAIYQAQLLEMPPAPSRVAPQPLPPALDSIILRAVAKSFHDRFASAQAFSNALATLGNAPVDVAAPTEPRDVPTLISDSPTLASETRPIPNVEIVRVPSTVEPPTFRLQPAAPAAAVQPKSESLGLLAIVLGLVITLLQVMSMLYALRELVDPLAHLTELQGVPTADARDEIETLGRIAAALGLVKSLSLLVLCAALIAIGVALLRRAPSSPRWARTWSTWALFFVGLGIVLDAMAVPIRSSMMSRVPAKQELAASLGWALGIALLVGATIVEVLVIVGIRVWARKIESAAEHAV